MISIRMFALVIAIVALPVPSYSQVTDLPAGPYGGQFRDEATGKTWLDVSNFYGMSYAQIVAFLTGTPFRIATKAEVETLFNSLGNMPTAIGAESRCVNMTCISGFYDDSASGSNPNLFGLASVYWSLQPIPEFSRAITDDLGDPAGNYNVGAWAIEGLCASSDVYSLDMNCDGIDEKVVWRNDTGNWYIRFSGSSEVLMQQWGLPGDYPILGDYDGDAIPDLVVWRPTDGNWFVKKSSTLFDASQATVQQFGLPGDVPMRGDYDADGILDYAVWRPSEGNWYVLRSSDHQAVVQQWGLPGDVPVTGGRPLR